MHPLSEQIIGQILNPSPPAGAPEPVAQAEPCTIAQILHPRPPAGGYVGPERRMQGYLIAEVIADPTAFDRPASPWDTRV